MERLYLTPRPRAGGRRPPRCIANPPRSSQENKLDNIVVVHARQRLAAIRGFDN